MTRKRHLPTIIFIFILVFTALACQAGAIGPAGPVDTEAIVAQAVATIQAQSTNATPIGSTTAVANLATLDSDLETKFINVYQRANPAVVHIFVYEIFNEKEFLLGTGSGFLIDKEGHIVTNNHVITDGDAFEIVYADGQRSRAELVGADVDSDLAVIKAEYIPEEMNPVELGDSRELQVGQMVVAIGNPFDEAGSMSIGVVSGLGRSLISTHQAEGGGYYRLPQVIQTDAAINPGNSGGPLLDLDGRVIGVNSAIRTGTGANTGVGFSIPVNAVHRIAPQLIENGAYAYPFIGIRMQTLNSSAASSLNLPQTDGAYILDVNPNTPAAAAGLRSGYNNFRPAPGGDLIIAINNQTIKSSDDLISYLVFETEVGQTVQLTVIREGKEITVPLTLGKRP